MDLNRFFFAIKDYNYSIVKLDKFPDYKKGDDLDIYTDDLVGLTRLILKIGNQYLNEENCRIKVSERKNKHHLHIDFYFNNELDLRFDLFTSPLRFKKLTLKKDLFSEVLKNKVSFESSYGKKKYPVYVPCRMDDLLVRYLEYLEYYKKRPEKKKHLEYVLKKTSSDESRAIFKDKLKQYL